MATTGPTTLRATGAFIAFGFGEFTHTTASAGATINVLPTWSTVRAVVQALPKGATLTAKAGDGPSVTTQKVGPLTLRTN